ncbi:hypothetical protein ABB02_01826 [Clostridiaceae bacterium JG1575]|nr:hypothetical protein ABB02_01826 [Clostridiaceae bacterium JG1575]
MTMSIPKRYAFKERYRDYNPNKDDRLRLRQDIRSFLLDLSEYQVDVQKLCEVPTTQEERNDLLNLALILINDEAIARDFVREGVLPLRKIRQNFRVPKDFLEPHQGLLIAYMLLFGTERYSALARQLSIGIPSTGAPKAWDNNQGIRLKSFGLTCAVLTPYGEFRFLDPAQKNTVTGDFITGSPALLKPKRTLALGALVLLILASLFVFSYFFNQEARSVTLLGETEATFHFNRFGRLVSASGTNASGKAVLKDLVYSDKKVDSTLALFLEKAVKEKLLPQGSELTLVVLNGRFRPEDFQGDALQSQVRAHRLTLRINLGDGTSLRLPLPAP